MRLGRLIRGDIHFQWKYGFYFIYFILTVLYVCGIAALFLTVQFAFRKEAGKEG